LNQVSQCSRSKKDKDLVEAGIEEAISNAPVVFTDGSCDKKEGCVGGSIIWRTKDDYLEEFPVQCEGSTAQSAEVTGILKSI